MNIGAWFTIGLVLLGILYIITGGFGKFRP